MNIDKYTSEYMAGMAGWCSPQKAKRIYEIIKERNLKFGVEIGVFAGKSLCAAGIAFSELGGEIIGIDAYKYEPAADDENQTNRDWWANLDYDAFHREALRHINALDINKSTFIWKNTSRDAYRTFKESTYSEIDFLHIDGNHSQWASSFDVVTWVPEVRSGGIICMDDVNWDSTAIAQTLLSKKADFLCFGSEEEKNYAFYVKK